jgi:hypothetical protein
MLRKPALSRKPLTLAFPTHFFRVPSCCAWTRLIPNSDINSLILDYLVMEGYPKAAEKFSKEANLQEQQEDSEIADRREIQDHIHNGDIEAAIVGLNQLDPEVSSSAFSLSDIPPPAMIRIRVSTCTTLRLRPLMRNNHFFYELLSLSLLVIHLLSQVYV